MKTKKHVYRLIGAICALAAVACVDESFDLSDVSTDITIGSDKTTLLPLGYLEEKTLGDLMGDQEIEGLERDENGNYSMHFEGDMDDFGVEGIDHVVEIPAINSSFVTDYPKFGLTEHVQKVDEYFDIESSYGNLNVISGVTVPVESGLRITGKENGNLTEGFSYDVPEMISGIKRIYLKPTEEGDPGARVDLRFLLNDLTAINGGGHVTLELKAPKGCNIYDGNGNHVEDGEFAVTEFDFSEEEYELKFLAFVESVANNEEIKEGNINFSIDLEYHISFEMTTKAGSLTLNQGPQLHIMSNFAYADADIVLNEVALLDHMKPEGGDLEIKDLPEEVVSINSLTFAEESRLTLTAGGFDWMKEDLAEKIIIDVWLPDYIILHENVEIGYNAEEHKLHTTLNTLLHGIEVDLDAIDFGDEGLGPRNGTVTISFAPEIDARIAKGTEIKLSSIMHEGEMTLSAGIKEAELDIRSISGEMNYTYDYSEKLNLKELGNLVIDGTGLNPVIKINLENPFTFEVMASFNVVPYIDGEIQTDRAINTNGYDGVGYVTIPAATVEGGAVKPTAVTLILGTEDSKGDYTSDEYIFVPCDIEKLLSGEFPDEIEMNVSIATDPLKEITLYTADEYKLKCSYEFDMPIAIGSEMGIHYSDELSFENMKGGNPFESLAEIDGIKVGDVAIIANVTTTLPVDLTASAYFLDNEGKELEGLVVLPEDKNTIYGSEDGTTPKESEVRLEIYLDDDGDIRQLANIGAIGFALDADAATEEDVVALNDKQYVSVKLQLELTGGITFDLEALQ